MLSMVATGSTGAREGPLNREPAVHELIKSFLTPISIAYDRNHGPIPQLSASTHKVQVNGLVPSPQVFDISRLQSMPQHTVICALQCAGNRRHTMRTTLKEVQGIDWGDAAIMNCSWRGPLLADVLAEAGLTEQDKIVESVDKANGVAVASAADAENKQHLVFTTRAQETENDDNYSVSIPLARALDRKAEAILALEVNGGPLTPEHGAPVRVIVPGVAGARSVKWVEEITVSNNESKGFYQQFDYKVLPPEVTTSEEAKKHWESTPSLQAMPVNSVIAVPESGSMVQLGLDGKIDVTGYALPGGDGGPVTHVEISVDGGSTWTQAELLQGAGTDEGRWCWCLWTARVPVEKGKPRTVLSRARDQQGVWQEKAPVWNLRGVAYNGYGEAKDLEIV